MPNGKIRAVLVIIVPLTIAAQTLLISTFSFTAVVVLANLAKELIWMRADHTRSMIQSSAAYVASLDRELAVPAMRVACMGGFSCKFIL